MLESIENYKTHIAHPRHDAVKNEEWHYNWGAYIYGQFQKGNNGIMSHFKMSLLRSYARGKQDINQYKSLLLNNDNDTKTIPSTVDDGSEARNRAFNEGYMSVDFNKILNPMPKFIKSIIGKFEGEEHEIVVSAIDKFSAFEKENEKAKLWFESKYSKELEPIDAIMGVEIPKSSYVPQSNQEMEMYEQAGGFKLRYESAMEKILTHAIYTKSNINDIQRRCLYDAVTLNMITVMDDVDIDTQQCYLKYINPDDVVIQYCKDGQYQKAAWGGVQEYFTIADLRIESGLEEEKILSIVKTSNGRFGNPRLESDEDYELQRGGFYKYDDFIIPVFHYYVKSFDRHHKIQTQRKNGTYKQEVRINDVGELNKDQKKNGSRDVRTVYEGKWIMGTTHVFGTGKMSHIPFNKKTKDVNIPIHVVEIIGEPILDSAIPLLDQIQLDFLKLQNLRATAPPPGWIIQLGALENVSFDNKTWTPLELLSLATQKGTVIYKAGVHQGSIPGEKTYTQGKPVEWNPGGMGQAIYELIFSLEKNFQMLAEMMGIDRVSALMKTPAEQAVGVTQLGIDATSNTLQPLYSGWVDAKEKAANSIACRVPSIVYFNKTNHDVGYYDIVGEADYETLCQAIGRHPIQFGAYIYAKATEQERNEIKQAGLVAMQAGKNGVPGISMADYLLVLQYMNRPGGMNFCRSYLAYREQVKQVEDNKQSKENIMLQSQESGKQEEAKIKLEVQASKEKISGEIALIKAKGEEDRKTLALKYSLERGINPEISEENAAVTQEAAPMQEGEFGDMMQQTEQPMGEEEVPAMM